MVILRSQNKISDFLMILACDCPFNGLLVMKRILNDQFRVSIGEQIKNKNKSHYKKKKLL